MVEVNDIGEQVANALQYDLEYDNLIMASMRGRAGQVMGTGFSGGKVQLGVRTTKAVKKIGCSNLKQMVEDNKIIFYREVNGVIRLKIPASSATRIETFVEGYEGIIDLNGGDDSIIVIRQE